MLYACLFFHSHTLFLAAYNINDDDANVIIRESKVIKFSVVPGIDV